MKQVRGGRTFSLAAIRYANLKRQGFVPGAPNLFLAVVRHGRGGLFLELKAERGRLSPVQRDLHMVLRASYQVEVVYGFEEAVTTIVTYLTGGRSK